MSTTTFIGELVHHTCPVCGVHYGLEAGYRKVREEKGGDWHCPNGHSLVFRETDLQRAEKAARRAQELLDLERRCHGDTRDRLIKVERSRSAIAGVATRLKNRVKHGVCPCCNRTFKQLAEHMKAKHPDYLEPAP